MRCQTRTNIPAEPPHQEGVTLIIPAGEWIEIQEGAPAKPGFVRVRWDRYEKGMISLYIPETYVERAGEAAI